MAILGLLILAAATVFGVEAALGNRAYTDVEVFGTGYSIPVAAVFVIGAATMAVAVLGLFMITSALHRRRAHRTEAKHRTYREQTDTRLTETDRTNAELVAENDRLRGELAAERRAAATMGGVAVPPGAGDVAYGDQVSDAVRSDTISDTGRFDPYPTDRAGTDDGVVNTEASRDYDRAERHDDKAGVVGRFRGNR